MAFFSYIMNETDEPKAAAPERVFRFSAEARDQAGKFEPLRESILDWISKNVVTLKEEERRVSSLTLHDHNLGVAQYDRDGERYFAVRYTRGREGLSRDPAGNAALKVTTEIVIRAGEKDLDVFITKAHEKRKYARLAQQDRYVKPPSIFPVIARHIDVEECGWPLSLSLTEMRPDSDFAKLGNLIYDSNRTLPVILAFGAQNGDHPEWDKDSLVKLAPKVYGAAHVVYIPFTLIDQFQRKIGSKWLPRPGQVREFRQGFKSHDVLTVHPIWAELSRRPEEREGQLPERVHAVLSRDFDRRGKEAVLTFDDIYSPIVNQALANRNRTSNPEEVIALLMAKAEIEAKKLEEQNKMVVELLEMNEALGKEIETLKERLKEGAPVPVKNSNKSSVKAHWKVASIEFGVPVPDRIEHVEAWAKEYFPDSLVLCKPFLDECKHINNYGKSRTENFYKLLRIMGLYYGEHHSSDLKRKKEHFLGSGSLSEILKRQGLEALKSSTTTLSTYRANYSVQDPRGMRWDLDWHAKDGSVDSDPRNMLRIYYADSEADKRSPARGKHFFVIGKGPGHLPIASF